MAKVKAYYDKGLFLPISDQPSFFAYQVEVDEVTLQQCNQLREIFDKLKVKHVSSSFPRDAQKLADQFASELAAVMKVRRRKNVSIDNAEQSDE